MRKLTVIKPGENKGAKVREGRVIDPSQRSYGNVASHWGEAPRGYSYTCSDSEGRQGKGRAITFNDKDDEYETKKSSDPVKTK